MDGLSTVGGVVGLAVQVAKTAKQIYDFINSVKDSPAEFKVFAQELETIHNILTSWATQTAPSSNVSIVNAIKDCQLHLTELDQTVAKYRSLDGSGRREQLFRGLKGTLGKKKVQEIQGKLESTKSTLQVAIAGALHSDVQLIYQELRTFTSRQGYVSSQIPGILQHRYEQTDFQVSNATAIEQAVESVSEQVARNTEDFSSLLCISQQRSTSRQSLKSVQEAVRPLVDAEIRKQVTSFGDEIGHVIREEYRRRPLRLGSIEDERESSSRLNSISYMPGEYDNSSQRRNGNRKSSRNQRVTGTRRNKKAKLTRPSNRFKNQMQPPSERVKTKWMRRHETSFGILIFRCDVHVISDRMTYSSAIKFSFTFIPEPQYSLAISLYSISVAQSGWNRIPTFNLQQFNIVPYDSAIFNLAIYGDAEELRALLVSGKASVFDVNEDGGTALHYAAFYGRLDLCKILIDHGANVSADLGSGSPLKDLLINPENSKATAKILRLFLANGADPCQMESPGSAPLEFAHYTGTEYLTEIVQILMPYKGLNEVVTRGELHQNDETELPWFLYLLYTRIYSFALIPDDLDKLQYLGANFTQVDENFSLRIVLLYGLSQYSHYPRKRAIPILKRSIELCPFTHNINQLWGTPTTLAYNRWQFDLWLEALMQTGENIEKFLEDDLRIMQSYDIHVLECDRACCRKDETEYRPIWPIYTCRDLYFGGLLRYYKFDDGTGEWVSRTDGETKDEGTVHPGPCLCYNCWESKIEDEETEDEEDEDEESEDEANVCPWFWPCHKKFMIEEEEIEYERYRSIFEDLVIRKGRVEYDRNWSGFKKRCWYRWRFMQREKSVLRYERYRSIFEDLENRKGRVKYDRNWSRFKRLCWCRWMDEKDVSENNQPEKDSGRAGYKKSMDQEDQWESDPFGGALRSKWGEFVFELDKPIIAFLFTIWFVFQQTLVVEKLVHQASSIQTPGNTLRISQESSERTNSNVSNTTDVGRIGQAGNSASSVEPLFDSESNSGQTKKSKKVRFGRLWKRSKPT